MANFQTAWQQLVEHFEKYCPHWNLGLSLAASKQTHIHFKLLTMCNMSNLQKYICNIWTPKNIIKTLKPKLQKHKVLLTSWCWGARGSTSSVPLVGGVSYSPLHWARSLGCTVGLWSASCPFQWLIQKECFLVYIITLTAAAVRVTGIVGLGVILWKEGRDTARTFREEDDEG